MNPLRVMLVDDHPVVCHGLRKMLEAPADIEVVGQAGDSAEALEKLRALRPDVAIVDIGLPHASGIELVKTAAEYGIATRCLVLSAHRGGDCVLRAIKAGARGYLPKDGVEATALADSVRRVGRGELVLHPDIANDLALALVAPQDSDNTPPLTEREAQVLRLIAQGMQNKEIAGELSLTVATVKHHVGRVLGKLGAGSRTEALVKAQKLGLLAEHNGPR